MHEIRATRTTDAPKAEIWDVLDDFGSVDAWTPSIASARIVAGPETGEGATRECVLETGDTAEEKIVEYRPESSLTIEFTDPGPLPVKEYFAEWSVTDTDGSRTEVTLEGRYTPRYGPVGWLMAKTVMNSKLEEGYEAALEGLADHLQNGHDRSETDG